MLTVTVEQRHQPLYHKNEPIQSATFEIFLTVRIFSWVCPCAPLTALQGEKNYLRMTPNYCQQMSDSYNSHPFYSSGFKIRFEGLPIFIFSYPFFT